MKQVTLVLMALCVAFTQGIEYDASDEGGETRTQEVKSTEDYVPDYGQQKDDVGDVVAEPRIVGGSAASVGQFPWHVAVMKDGVEFCGGSLISSQWVLTAGHCVEKATTILLFFGVLPAFCDPSACVIQMTNSYVLHERYRFGLDSKNPATGRAVMENDIGLIKLVHPICASTNIIAPLRLPRRAHQSMQFVGENVTVSGWGSTTYPPKETSKTLMFANLEVISNTKCIADFHGTISILPTNICTGGNKARSAYSGDSGGALVWKDANGTYFQIGIVSFGSGVGSPLDYPNGFTRVTSYLDWISNKTGIAIEE